jgi:hypothetical protein
MGLLISATYTGEVASPARPEKPAVVGNYYNNNIVGSFGQDLGWSLVGCSSPIAVGKTCYRIQFFWEGLREAFEKPRNSFYVRERVWCRVFC